MFDEIAQQYFESPEQFAFTIKQLQRFRAAVRDYPRWEDFEEHRDNSGDPHGKFLDLALEHEDAKKVVLGSPPPQLDQHTREMLAAIRTKPP